MARVKRLSLHILGSEIIALQYGEPDDMPRGDCGTTASQVEQAYPARIGFQIDPIPSLAEAE